MQDIHAVLAILVLQKKHGKPVQQSEDEYYAQFSETPWQRLMHLRRVFLTRLRPKERSTRFERPEASMPVRTGEV